MKTSTYNLEQELKKLKSKLDTTERNLKTLKTSTDKSIANLQTQVKDKESAINKETKAHKKDNTEKNEEITKLTKKLKDNSNKQGASWQKERPTALHTLTLSVHAPGVGL